ncbi:MAG: 2-amino-4-hydroxy-6-hydroxymethyldihydropteridine diphosphokinase [Bacteroidales bacterium]|nr:2-amino-4-hydroxy-6-hydroxymethyldihydropteridine diphosphokinase [Bacteroidales bacterium]
MPVHSRAFIAIGSNLGNPRRQVASAVAALAELPDSQLVAVSPWYRSAAIGPGEQPDYLNGVAELRTRLAPRRLLAALQAIEETQGRQRTERWAARTLDLDILLYGDAVIAEPDLIVPHPRLAERNFVLYPLADLAPTLVLPDGTPLGELLTELLAKCESGGIVRDSDGE